MSESERATLIEPIRITGFGRLLAFVRRSVALLLGVGAAFLSLGIASCLCLWFFSFATGNRDYNFFGFSWESFLDEIFDFKILIVFLGFPVLAIIGEKLSGLLTRPDRVSGVLKRGRISWIARRFGTLGFRIAIVNLLVFAAMAAYQLYTSRLL